MQKSICKLLIVLCMLHCGDAMAQRVLVHEEPDTSGEIPSFGPNRAIFYYPLIKIGTFVPVYDVGMYLNPWCTAMSYELRTKAKICKWNALVLDIGYRCDRFSIKEDPDHIIPYYGGNSKRSRVSCHNVTFALCDRINFGRRANIQGIYLDFGFYGDFIFRSSHLTVYEYYDSNSQNGTHVRSKTRVTKLQYINQLNYGLTARFGWEWGSFYGCYRMTDLILDPDPFTPWPDMPKLTVGLEWYFVSY
jgi:hypothetical protein